MAEQVSSWQIDITHYWISHPIEQHLANLRCCIVFSAAQLPHENHEVIYLPFRKVVTGSEWWIENCDTNIWVMWKQGIRKPQKKKRCIIRPVIRRSAIATRIKDVTIPAHLHPARTVSIKGTPKTTQFLWDATGQMSRVQTNEDFLQ